MNKKHILLFALLTLFSFSVFSQVHNSSQPHSGRINDAAISTKNLFTAGQDGFIIKWNEDGTGEHYQISDLEVKLIAVNPNGMDIAIYETDGYSINRISVWDWSKQTRKFAKRITDSVASLSYSEKGSWLMVGTTSMDGIIFLDSQRGTVLKKVNDAPGMVTLSLTSATENSCIMYSQLGSLIYTNLKTRVQKAEISVDSNLQQPLLFNNDIFFAGVKNNYIYIYHAVTGDVLAKIQSKNPIIASGRNDTNLYFTEKDGRNYVLKMIQTDGIHVFQNPVIVQTFFAENRPDVTKLLKNASTLYALCADGSVHKTSVEPTTELVTLNKVSEKVYSKIFDIASENSEFYFLTDSSVFVSSYINKTITQISTNNGYTNIIPFNDSVIFWSVNTTKPVTIRTNNSQEQSTELYKPTSTIQVIHRKDDKLIIVEGSSSVKLLDLTTKNVRTLYTGTGVQDALLYSDNDLYVAKTATTNPKSALIHVNVQTQETVALPITAEVAFSLSQNSSSSNVFYGVAVYAGSTKRTDIFTYYPSSNQYIALLQWGDEDTQAFTQFNEGMLYTNIGKTQIRALNVSTKRETLFTRFASLPVKIAVDNTLLVVLNKDGSISWYNSKTNTRYANWYVTVNGEWIEY